MSILSLSSISAGLSSVFSTFEPSKVGSFSNAVAGMRIVCFAADSVKYFLEKTPLSGLTGMFQNVISIQPIFTIAGTLNALRFTKFNSLKAASTVLGALGELCENVSFYNGFDFSSFSKISSRIGMVDYACNGFYCGSAALSLINRNWVGAKKQRESEAQNIAKLKNFKDVAQVVGTGLSIYAAYSSNKYVDVASKVALRAADCLSLRLAISA